jgi:hypothetical protein
LYVLKSLSRNVGAFLLGGIWYVCGKTEMKIKTIYSILLTMLVVLSSCRKNTMHDVYFHGRVTYSCSGLPGPGIELKIGVSHLTGSPSGETVGYATTNSDGYYSLTADVPGKGGIDSYYLQSRYSSGIGVNGSHAGTQDKDILMDGSAWDGGTTKILNLHFKNVNPYDSADLLSNFMLMDGNSVYQPVQGVPTLQGQNIDTTISVTVSLLNLYYFKFDLRRNNYPTVERDTLIIDPCANGIGHDIFY